MSDAQTAGLIAYTLGGLVVGGRVWVRGMRSVRARSNPGIWGTALLLPTLLCAVAWPLVGLIGLLLARARE